MTLRAMILGAVSAATLIAPTLAEAFQTGQAELTVADAKGARVLEGFVWYPTDATDGRVRVHNNPVWAGIDVIKDAPVADGSFPLVVLSHGMFGNAMNQSWLGQALVDQGYIVAAINHPGTSTWSQDPDARRQLWERPRDISRVIDHFLTDAGLPIDEDRIFAAGHSLGGFTAVALAGGRYDGAKADAMCAAGEDPVCEIFQAWEVAKSPSDRAMMEGDLSDGRIKAFAVFDLGGTQFFAPDSLKGITSPMLIYGASVDYTWIDLDRESRALAAHVPQGASIYREPDGLAHFDFMGLCTSKGLDILKEEEPDDVMVCIDGTDARQAKHAQIAAEVDAFFDAAE